MSTAAQKSATSQHGPLVDRDALIALIRPEIQRTSAAAFARRCGIDEDNITKLLRGERNPRLWMADRLLTLGLGRPDLLAGVLVSPPGEHHRAGDGLPQGGPA